MSQSDIGTDPVSAVINDGTVELGEEMHFADIEADAPWKLSQGTPSRPLFGRLPLARLVPQDVHSVLGYVDAASVLSGAVMSHCPRRGWRAP